VWIAISESTIENGTMVRAPKPAGDKPLPHTWDERLLFYRCAVDERDAEPVELDPGQAFVFSGLVPHRSGVNRGAAPRIAYSVSFVSPRTRLRANGQAFGDRVPVLRGGRPIREVMEENAAAGAAVLAEIAARAPLERDVLLGRERAYRSAIAHGDEALAERELLALLAIVPRSEEAMGDLVQARARVDQIVREYEKIRGTDPRVERLLLERVLELAPDDGLARAALADLPVRGSAPGVVPR
jgi:hypothetical protein